MLAQLLKDKKSYKIFICICFKSFGKSKENKFSDSSLLS